MTDDESLAALIERLAVAFPGHPRERVERIATTAWWMFDASAGDQPAHERVTEWYARRQLTSPASPN